ncbi:odorant receptor 85c-like [Halyomorpha halys]|uniref:odorant receptor 85c-like n=1 Tax=Halyomorpha halys TaxID=286706 RepID=UPI0006D4EF62|nr:uncharacterized protein LOC106690972 [Halyomorpha halys]
MFFFIGIQLISVITVNSFIINTKIETAGDFTQVINSLIVSLSFITGILKLMILHFTSGKFKAMVDFLESFPSDGIVFPTRKKFLIYSVCNLTTISSWLIYGIVTKGWPWDADFAWDKTTPTGHCLGITLQIVSSLPGGTTHLMIDSVLGAAVERLRPQIKNLKNVYYRIGPNLKENKLIIKEAVELHNAIQRSVYLINNAFSLMFMFQVISLAPLICINAFVITKIGDVRYILTSVLPMSLCVCGQVYMFFGSGQLLATEMENMDHVCYDNEWYLAPVQTRRELTIIMECSRKQLSINAYGVAFANNVNLLAVVQQGYSYFLFLHTMADIIDSY